MNARRTLKWLQILQSSRCLVEIQLLRFVCHFLGVALVIYATDDNESFRSCGSFVYAMLISEASVHCWSVPSFKLFLSTLNGGRYNKIGMRVLQTNMLAETQCPLETPLYCRNVVEVGKTTLLRACVCGLVASLPDLLGLQILKRVSGPGNQNRTKMWKVFGC